MALDKALIRKVMKNKRLLINKETFFLHSQAIIHKVLQHPLYLQAKTVGIYVSLPGEVDTLSLIQEALKTHRVCVPKVIGQDMEFYEIYSLNDLQEGTFHVLEPMRAELIAPQDIDLMIVPMLAFDSKLNRVGYGKGFYDKYFSRGFQGYKMGLAFSFQEVDEINNDAFDCPLDEVMTE